MAELASQNNRLERVNVLGVGITALNMDSALNAILQALEQRRKGYICITGVHGVMEAQTDPEVKRLLNQSFLCTPDGMPMVWMARLNGFKEVDRVYGPDLMLAILAISAERGLRHFFYGACDGVVERLKETMEKRFPGVAVVGVYEPPFRPLNRDEERELTDLVAQTKPDIFWVGISTPKQERFMAEYLPKLNVPIMVGVGAAFDFLCGKVRQAPRWMQRSGLEWFYRMCQEPRRLGPRYLRNNPRFAFKAMCQLLRLKSYKME